jgi:phosphatidylglycerophosphate synthase
MPNYPFREWVAVTLTVARLVLVWGLIASYHQAFWISVIWLVAIVVVDIGDGAVARFFNADGPLRRMTDATIDQLSIGGAMIGLILVRPEYHTPVYDGFWLYLVTVRVAYVYVTARSLRRYRVLLRGKGILHKQGTLSYVVLALIMIHGADDPIIWNVLSGVILINGLLMIDMLDAYTSIVRHQFRENTSLAVIETYGGIYRARRVTHP